jgi:hypothetical protein
VGKQSGSGKESEGGGVFGLNSVQRSKQSNSIVD